MSKANVLTLKRGWFLDDDREPAKALVVRQSRPARVEKLHTPKEVAVILRCGVDHVYDLINKKRLDYQPSGKRKLIPESALLHYLETEKEKAG